MILGLGFALSLDATGAAASIEYGKKNIQKKACYLTIHLSIMVLKNNTHTQKNLKPLHVQKWIWFQLYYTLISPLKGYSNSRKLFRGRFPSNCLVVHRNHFFYLKIIVKGERGWFIFIRVIFFIYSFVRLNWVQGSPRGRRGRG